MTATSTRRDKIAGTFIGHSDSSITTSPVSGQLVAEHGDAVTPTKPNRARQLCRSHHLSPPRLTSRRMAKPQDTPEHPDTNTAATEQLVVFFQSLPVPQSTDICTLPYLDARFRRQLKPPELRPV